MGDDGDRLVNNCFTSWGRKNLGGFVRAKLIGPTTNDYRTVKRYIYNGDNQIMRIEDALTNKTYFTYDAINRVSAVIQTNRGVEAKTSYFYDGLDRATNVVYADVVATASVSRGSQMSLRSVTQTRTWAMATVPKHATAAAAIRTFFIASNLLDLVSSIRCETSN